VLKTYDYEQLKELGGHEVLTEDGVKVGYVDLIFRDVDTGEPEWLGIWDGLPDTKPRLLVPVRDVVVEGDAVRVPWQADRIRNAPTYEAPGDLVIGHDSVVDISPETEREAYAHYGVEPATEREEPVEVIRFRVWRIQSF
jgi:sporulation protein YlmC with PRC-barrel domain